VRINLAAFFVGWGERLALAGKKEVWLALTFFAVFLNMGGNLLSVKTLSEGILLSGGGNFLDKRLASTYSWCSL
jgi:hypothetical protein